jgi:hypothetical protein
LHYKVLAFWQLLRVGLLPMPTPRPKSLESAASDEPAALHTRAIADLRFIRETMARATSYTAFSGWGLIIVGCGALIAGLVAAREAALLSRLYIWLADAGFSVLLGAISAALKARSWQQPLFGGPIRKFSLSFAPAIMAGAVLTAFMVKSGSAVLLPGLWLLLYGAGLAAAGTLSVWVVPFMGACFFVLGVIALGGPSAWANTLLIAGFAGVHIISGAMIARRYGG